MAKIEVARVVDAPRRAVWAELTDVASHVEWMGDARAIRFHGPQTSGVGTSFECDTQVGPLRTTDHMEITRWDRNRAMGVRHTGLVTGEGVFELVRKRQGRTEIVWRERLQFPMWLGGPVGGLFAKPVLRRIWRKNLLRLANRIEAGPG